MMDDVHVTPTRTGQAPPLACLLVAFGALGLGVGFFFWPAWLLVAVVGVWVVVER